MNLNRETDRLFAYHEATKHSYASVRAARHSLDWANMPEPFRHYEGAPVVDLPADPPPPLTPALDILLDAAAPFPAGDCTADFLSRLFFYSCSISATKLVRATGYRYSLRVNPSSGNLHPTEFHFAARGLARWEDGLYHYRPSAHMAELRATGNWTDRLAGSSSPLALVLTSIPWREAWKYRSRAYRYCLHDAGHAWQSVVLAARALGCRAQARGHFADQRVAEALGVGDEWPLLLIEIDLPASSAAGVREEWFGGRPNRLSEEPVEYPLIDAIHASSSLFATDPPVQPARPVPGRAGPIALPAPVSASRPFGETVRQRRSALDFEGGDRTITFAQLSTLLAAGFQPLQADFGEGLVRAYLYVHRVDGLEPGLYRHDGPSGTLELLRPGDQRLWAAALSLGQDLAANSCVTFSLVADLPRAAALHGNRGYRYAHFEAGAIGQRFYLAAEAMGFRSTGIGAFYDDDVHNYLGLSPADGQVIYHFACGHAVRDDRLAPEE